MSNEDKILGKSLKFEMNKSAADTAMSESEEARQLAVEMERKRHALKQVSVDTKEDVRGNFDSNHELSRLFFNTSKYDDKIFEIKQAIDSGASIVNVISPGYNSSPGRELTDMVIKTAIQDASSLPVDATDEERAADREARASDRRNSIVSNVSYDTAMSEADNVGVIENSLLGGSKYNRESPQNVALAWVMSRAQEQAAGAAPSSGIDDLGFGNDEEGEAVSAYAVAASLRADDLIYDLNAFDTYCYQCIREGSLNIEEIEAAANERRRQMKSGELDLPGSAVDAIARMHARLNAVAGRDVDSAFFPYQLGLNRTDYDNIKKSIGADIEMSGSISMPDYDIADIAHWATVTAGITDRSTNLEDGYPVALTERSENREIVRLIDENEKIMEMFVSAPSEKEEKIVILGLIDALKKSAGNDRGNLYNNLKKEVSSILVEVKNLNSYSEAVSAMSEEPDMPEEVVAEDAVEPEAVSTPRGQSEIDSLLGINAPEASVPESSGAADVPASGTVKSYAKWIKDNLLSQMRSSLPAKNPDITPKGFISQLESFLISNSPDLSKMDNDDRRKFFNALLVQSKGMMSGRITPPIKKVLDLYLSRGGAGKFAYDRFVEGLQKKASSSGAGMDKEAASPNMKAMQDSLMSGKDRRRHGRHMNAYIQNYSMELVRDSLINSWNKGVTQAIPATINMNTIQVGAFELHDELFSGERSGSMDEFISALETAHKNKSVTVTSANGTSAQSEIEGFATDSPNIQLHRNNGIVNIILRDPTIEAPVDTKCTVEMTVGNNVEVMASHEYAPFVGSTMGISPGGGNDAVRDAYVNRIRETRDDHGVTVNRGPLPNWAPDVYNFSDASSSEIGHSNNSHNIRLALSRRIRLAAQYQAKIDMNDDDSHFYRCGLKYIKAEIAEMSECLKWADDNIPDAVEWAGAASEGEIDVGRRDRSRSLLRYSDSNSNSFYDDVMARCKDAGVVIPVIDKSFDIDSVRKVVSDDIYLKFKDIYEQAELDWGREGTTTARSFMIMKGFERLSPTPFADRLKNIMTAYSGAAAKSEKLRSTLILVTTDTPAASGGGSAPTDVETIDPGGRQATPFYSEFDVTNVVISANVMSSDEIGEYLEMFATDMIKSALEKVEDPELEEKISNFKVPTAMSKRLASSLGGLDMSKVRRYLKTLVADMFGTFVDSEYSISAVVSNYKAKIEEDILSQQRDSKSAEDLGIEIRVPMVGQSEYLTRKNSSWNLFNDKFGKSMTRVNARSARLDLLYRMLDANVVPVLSGNHSEFSTSGDLRIVSYGTASEELVMDIVREMALKFGNAPKPLSAKERQMVTKDMVDSATSQMMRECQSEEEEIEMMKSDAIPNIIFLYGEPGSGKSIFPDVMATELGLRLMVTSLTNIYLADASTQFRGQSERRLNEFIELCRNAKDTVILIDEFHKFFTGGGPSRTEAISTVTERLQTAWNDHLSTYVENNVYIICTSNLSPENFTGQSEGGSSVSALMNRFQQKSNVPVPSNLESLMVYFTSDTMMNNLINEKFTSSIMREKIKLMISAHVGGNEDVKRALANSLYEQDSSFFTKGFLLPERSSLAMLKGKGVKTSKMTRDQQVDDFINGWLMARDIFRDMANPKKIETEDGVVEVAPLTQICHELQNKMQWDQLTEAEMAQVGSLSAKERDGTINDMEIATLDALRTKMDNEESMFSSASMRDLNNLAKTMLDSHRQFMGGDRNSLPLNYKTFWVASKMTSWRSVSDEGGKDENVKKQARTNSQKATCGWLEMSSVAYGKNAKELGIGLESFMTESDARYVENTLHRGVRSDERIMELASTGVNTMVEGVAVAANTYLGIRDDLPGAGFPERMGEIADIARKMGSTDGNTIALYSDEIVKSWSRIREAVLAYLGDKLNESLHRPVMMAAYRVAMVMRQFNNAKISDKISEAASQFASASSGTGGKSNEWLNTTIVAFADFARISLSSPDLGKYAADDDTFSATLDNDIASSESERRRIFTDVNSMFSQYKDIEVEIYDKSLLADAMNKAKDMENDEPQVVISEMSDEEVERLALGEDLDIDTDDEIVEDPAEEVPPVDPVGQPIDQEPVFEEDIPVDAPVPAVDDPVVPAPQGGTSAPSATGPVTDDVDKEEWKRQMAEDMKRKRDERKKRLAPPVVDDITRDASSDVIMMFSSQLELVPDTSSIGSAPSSTDYLFDTLVSSGVVDAYGNAVAPKKSPVKIVPEKIANTEKIAQAVPQSEVPHVDKGDFSIVDMAGAIQGLRGFERAYNEAVGAPQISTIAGRAVIVNPKTEENE